MSVLAIEGLRKSYKGHLSLTHREVIRGLDLNIESGEVFGLLGQNGAGKTTTIKMILSLIFPDAGTIRIFGEPNTSVEVRARVGFLPENPFFYDYLTGHEFLDFYGRLFGYPRAERERRSKAMLERVGMTERAGMPLRKYSKGMLQRIGMAQALINDPQFVILDEPMSGLDPIGRREFRDIILDLKRARQDGLLLLAHPLRRGGDLRQGRDPQGGPYRHVRPFGRPSSAPASSRGRSPSPVRRSRRSSSTASAASSSRRAARSRSSR